MVVAYHAMKAAIEKARQYGLGAVAVRNSNHYRAELNIPCDLVEK
jgi:LDH2 family malate/lactate/ureidoglycolate dehydrogenase